MKSEEQRKSKCPAGTGPAVCETRHVTGKTRHAWLSTRHVTVGTRHVRTGTRHVTVETWLAGAETWLAAAEKWIADAEKPIVRVEKLLANTEKWIARAKKPIASIEKWIAGAKKPFAGIEKWFAAVKTGFVTAEKWIAGVEKPFAGGEKWVAAVEKPFAVVEKSFVTAEQAVCMEMSKMFPSIDLDETWDFKRGREESARTRRYFDMAYSNTYQSNYLEDTRVTFENLPNLPEFMAVLGQHGYNDARIQQGEDLHSQSGSSHYLYLEKRQLAKAKGKEMGTLFKGMFSVYMRHVNRLKREFAFDQDLLFQLGLVGPRDRKRAAAVVQVTNFYETAINDPGVFAKLQPLGYTAEGLDSDFKKVKEYQTARVEYEKLNGECQELVQMRDKAFKMLRAWMAAFIATCKFAFADNLQALEKAGIFILNRPRSRKKEESAAKTGTGTGGS